MSKEYKQLSNLSNANFPIDQEGRVYHLAVKKGEVANRILSVGDPKRAELISTFLDNPQQTYVVASKRGFVIYTGTYKGVPVSIIATGMGIAMIDFVVRECRAIVEGNMAIIRLGTCGTPDTNVRIGSIVVPTSGSVLVRREPDAWTLSTTNVNDYYSISKPVIPSDTLSQLLVKNMKELVPSPHSIVEGLNATADSFYSSQGRIDSSFEDHNSNLIDYLTSKYPITSLEMETFHLFDLARASFNTIQCSAATIVLAQRRSNDFLDNNTLHVLEKQAGIAVLETLIKATLDNVMSSGVWNK